MNIFERPDKKKHTPLGSSNLGKFKVVRLGQIITEDMGKEGTNFERYFCLDQPFCFTLIVLPWTHGYYTSGKLHTSKSLAVNHLTAALIIILHMNILPSSVCLPTPRPYTFGTVKHFDLGGSTSWLSEIAKQLLKLCKEVLVYQCLLLI